MSITFTAYDPVAEKLVGEGINVNNGNAATLLDTLGVQVGERWEDRCGGGLPAGEVLGRVVLALGLAPVDEGVPFTVAVENPRWTDCGRRPGYLQDRLVELHALAQVAADNGWEVSWG